MIDTARALKPGQVINIMEALKRSMEIIPAKKKTQCEREQLALRRKGTRYVIPHLLH